MKIKGKRTTYNPDFFCPATRRYIEVATSRQNISMQRAKWDEAIRLGFPLQVYWWEGQRII
jgi:hypothetical protein